MRIIAGKLKGQAINEPHGRATHPMAEKVRGALFNVLGDIEGLRLLDAFAGSGALGFEALSRGASQVIAVENEKSAFEAMRRTQAALDLSGFKAVRANILAWSNGNPDEVLDIVLLDPPYNDLRRDQLSKVANRHLKGGGIAVLSWPGKEPAPNFEGLQIERNKLYGDAQLVFYRKTS